MNRIPWLILVSFCTLGVSSFLKAQSPLTSNLKGAVTDPSGAVVPGASVTLHGQGKNQKTKSDGQGHYSFGELNPGTCQRLAESAGFEAFARTVVIDGATKVDIYLKIESDKQSVNVEGESTGVSTDPGANGTGLILGPKELQALSDDPDELQQQLQAMAGPGGGPSGGQIYIDGFIGGNMPPKSSTREVRINSNPYAPEFDKPGFGRIEILTIPGTDLLHGQAFFQFNNQDFNSRNPLLTQSGKSPYSNKFYGGSVSGPIVKKKASFAFDFERRNIEENAFVLATILDGDLHPTSLSQAVVTPQKRLTMTPRVDYAINASINLTVRYQDVRIESDKDGVGGYNLASTAYSETETEHTIQATETAILSPRLINETRAQYMRTDTSNVAAGTGSETIVSGAFTGGASQVGHSGTLANSWELSNTSTLSHGAHTIKWDARLRQYLVDDTSQQDFGGTYTFFGGVGPDLDGNNQPVSGTAEQLTALEVYRRTLLFQQEGLSVSTIRAQGGGAPSSR